MVFARTIDNTLYTRKALADARDAYRDFCVVKTAPHSDGLADITVTVKREYHADARQVILEFWNFFLDTACKQHLESG